MNPAIRATDLGVEVKGSALLSGVDLTAEPGEWLSVIGPNGAGKSTLLRAIVGVVKHSGSLEIAGTDSATFGTKERSRLVAWVPQSPTLPVGMRVFDYVLLGRTPHLHPLARESASDLAIIEEVLDELDLTGLADRPIETLSGGERQRAVIGRALAQQAPIILLDEPTAALDLGHQQEVLDLLDRIRNGGDRTIVTTMHDLTLAGAYGDRIVMLAEGRIIAQGAAAEVITEAHLAKVYGADVVVTHQDGHVMVTPRLDRRSR